jgi:hypothetical protein
MTGNLPQDVQQHSSSIVQPAAGKLPKPASQLVDSHSVSRRFDELSLCLIIGVFLLVFKLVLIEEKCRRVGDSKHISHSFKCSDSVSR